MDVPFLDVLGAMCDPGLPLTIKERSQWGDPLGSQVRWAMSHEPYLPVSREALFPEHLAIELVVRCLPVGCCLHCKKKTQPTNDSLSIALQAHHQLPSLSKMNAYPHHVSP